MAKYIVTRASDDCSMPVRDCKYEKVHHLLRTRGKEPTEYMKQSYVDIHKEGDLWVGTSKKASKVWTLEIDDLCEFVKKNGRIILQKSSWAEIGYEVMIYDDYIE